uniref:Retrotransposon Orf1 n=1 Tax=Tanacetum cinerariifolium TaxID=118510 RepID=A0A6L2NR94_TANCI|nr:retrotransposon Orf1 [Tanacetum cinerariifolium]
MAYTSSSSSSSSSSDSKENVESRLDKGYHEVPLPFTRNYMPPKCDLRLIDEHFESVSVDVTSNIAPSDVMTVKTIDVNHKDKIKFVKTARETVKNEESSKQHKHHPRGNQRNWNNIIVLDLEKIKTAQAKETVDLKKKVKKNAKKEKVQNSKDEFIQDCQVSDKDKPGLEYKAASHAVEGFVNSFKMLENQENVESKLDKGYHEVPLPFTGNYMHPKHDLRLIDEHFESVSMDVTSNIAPSDVKTVNTVDVNHKGVFSTKEPKLVMKNNFSPLIIEDWHSDDEGEVEISPTLKAAQAKEIVDLKKRVKKIGKKEKVQNYRDVFIQDDNVLAEYTTNLEKAEKEKDELKLILEKLTNSSKSLNTLLESQVSDKDKIGLRYKAAYPAVEGFVNSSEMLENQENVTSRLDKGYHEVPPPLIGNYMPPKHDLRLINEHFESVSVDVTSNIAHSDVKIVQNVDVNFKGVFSTEEPKPIMKNNFSPLLIKDWHSDDESKVEISPIIKVKIVKPSIDKIKFVKTARETVKNKESLKQHKHHPRGNKRNWNNIMSQRLGSDFKMINKACYVCGSFEHLYYVCDKKVVKPVWNNTRRVNHKNFANKFTHLHPQRVFVPQAVLTRSGKINIAGASVTTAVRPVNTAGSKSTVNHPRLISKAFKRGHSLDIRPFNKYLANKSSVFNNKKVNAVRVNDSTARDRAVTDQAKEIADLKKRVKKTGKKKKVQNSIDEFIQNWYFYKKKFG